MGTSREIARQVQLDRASPAERKAVVCVCRKCGARISNKGTTGMCRPCAARTNNKCRHHPEMDWCPPSMRGEYRNLRYQGFSIEEAKRILLDHIAVRGVPA